MSVPLVYSPRVRELFAAPVHAGDARGPRAAVEAPGARLVLSAELGAGRLARLAFRAYGCPHLIAAAEAFCAAWEGREAAALADFRAADTLAALEVPVEKTGRILLLEDAVRALSATIASLNDTR